MTIKHPENDIAVITYEFPLNERIRILLRLEELYVRIQHYMRQSDHFAHHAALLTLFELLEITSRPDLKSDLLQELERQRQALILLRHHPNIAENKLNDVLENIDATHNKLVKMTGKIGQHIRDNEWLMLLKQRTTIAGGTSPSDLPSYYYWQNKSASKRRAELEAWYQPMYPIKEGVDILLNLLRQNAKSEQQNAKHGQFHQMSGGKSMQLLRLNLDSNLTCIPELSANRYAINIRFILSNVDGERAVTYDQDIPFVLEYCSLS